MLPSSVCKYHSCRSTTGGSELVRLKSYTTSSGVSRKAAGSGGSTMPPMWPALSPVTGQGSVTAGGSSVTAGRTRSAAVLPQASECAQQEQPSAHQPSFHPPSTQSSIQLTAQLELQQVAGTRSKELAWLAHAPHAAMRAHALRMLHDMEAQWRGWAAWAHAAAHETAAAMRVNTRFIGERTIGVEPPPSVAAGLMGLPGVGGTGAATGVAGEGAMGRGLPALAMRAQPPAVAAGGCGWCYASAWGCCCRGVPCTGCFTCFWPHACCAPHSVYTATCVAAAAAQRPEQCHKLLVMCPCQCRP